MLNLYPDVEIVLQGFLDEFKNLKQTIEVGVSVDGPAAAYAEVWEWGNARQTKQGPKTVLGVNPNGESVWLSSQAPHGYIRVNESRYVDIVKIGLGTVTFKGPTAQEIVSELEKTGVKMMEQIAEVVAETAPVDTGQLSESFKAVKPGDPLLKDDPGGTMESRFSRVLYLGGT